MIDAELNNIAVDVETRYIEDQPNPEQNCYVFAYTITIRNKGWQAAKLLTRHWVITDSNQKVQEVRGDGVIGEQPPVKTRRTIRLYLGHNARNRGGHDEGQLPDAGRRWLAFRCGNR